jgi:hypothetical protein
MFKVNQNKAWFSTNKTATDMQECSSEINAFLSPVGENKSNRKADWITLSSKLKAWTDGFNYDLPYFYL